MARVRSSKRVERRPDDMDFPNPPIRARSFDKYVKAAGALKGWGSAAEVFDQIESVRTVFVDFNRAVGVGGLPVRRIHTVHGESAGGKTVFALGLMKSFADAGYLAGYVDAEHTLGQRFVAEIVRDLSTKPNFLGMRPNSYEETIDAVNQFLELAGDISKDDPNHRSIVVIDTINKLVPKRELDKVVKDGGTELSKGHHGRYRAAVNQAWLDQLTPKIARSNCAFVVIAQERDDPDDTVDFFRNGGDTNFKIKGGRSLVFDASLVIRVGKAKPVWRNPDGKKSNDEIVGYGHRVRIWKSKVGHMDGKHSDCAFHFSNGKVTPPGLDLARDAVVVGAKLGVLSRNGAWFSYRGKRQQGLVKVLQHFANNPDRLAMLHADISQVIDKQDGRT